MHDENATTTPTDQARLNAEIAAGDGISSCPRCLKSYDSAVHVRQIRACWPVRCPFCRFDKWPPPDAREVSVDDELRRITMPHRRFINQCFSRSVGFIFESATVPNRNNRLRLVHGCYTPRGVPEGVRMPHAWVEIDGTIAFDPNHQRFYDRASYYDAIKALKEAEYTPKEVSSFILNVGTYGPWHEEVNPS